MSITYQVDHEKRRIVAIATGALGKRELVAYLKDLGALPACAAYDKIFDLSWVDSLLDLNIDTLKELAVFSAATDTPGQPAKLAIVAPQKNYFGLSRMYECFRDCVPTSNRISSAFQSRKDAERWLEIREENERAALPGLAASAP